MGLNRPDSRLAELIARIRHCRKCGLAKLRHHAVPGEGNPNARLLFVGEAPGAKEDQTGRPFVGPAGRFLNQLFVAFNIRREAVFITSCVKCRPPGNRNPTANELAACVGGWLLPQIELIDPEIIVLLGRMAALTLLDKPVKISEAHGTLVVRNGRKYFISYHPAAGLRFPRIAATMRTDFKALMELVRHP
jgi:DNA polymerase